MTEADQETSFEILRPPSDPLPVVMHAPHGGRGIPPDVRGNLLVEDATLAVELLRMTDHHTDQFARNLVAARGCIAFVNRMSRLVVDPERFLDPAIEEMEAVGMGAVYTRTHDQMSLRGSDPELRVALLDRYFHPYAEALADVVQEQLDQHGRCTLLDLHSYPSERLPYELHGARARPEICLGTDPSHTPPDLTDGVQTAARHLGFETALNTPFRGTYVPTRHFGRDTRVTSLMIEIRRDTYSDERTSELNEGSARVAEFLSDAVERVSG